MATQKRSYCIRSNLF